MEKENKNSKQCKIPLMHAPKCVQVARHAGAEKLSRMQSNCCADLVLDLRQVDKSSRRKQR
jgi:hypothetical protein